MQTGRQLILPSKSAPRRRTLVGLVPGGIQSATADGFQTEELTLARLLGWLTLPLRPCAGGVAGGSAGSPA